MDNLKVFIPIKEESQRVPGKNFRQFGGDLLYERCLKTFSDFNIYIDTDCYSLVDEIEKRENPKLHAIRRLGTLRGHETSVNKLIENFVTYYCSSVDIVCQIHVTNPFLKAETIRDAATFMTSADSVAGCNVLNSRLWRSEEYGLCPVNHNPMKLEQTQDLPKIYEENSTFYIFSVKSFLETKNRIGKRHTFHEVAFPENVDIDTENDFEMALKLQSVL